MDTKTPVYIEIFSSSESDDSSHKPSPSPPFTVDIEKFAEAGISEFDAGDFIDDDFGLSIRQESEKLRQQQLLIEQEVRRMVLFIA